jgi:hypothetical protein
MRLALTAGYCVFVCDNMAFQGDFTPVLAKHTKHFDLLDSLAVGIDRMQRNLKPMRKQIEAWRGTRISDEQARLVMYRAFIEGELEAPRYLARKVHQLYFEPEYPEFAGRNAWSLSNAFTTALKELDRDSRLPHVLAIFSLRCDEEE